MRSSSGRTKLIQSRRVMHRGRSRQFARSPAGRVELKGDCITTIVAITDQYGSGIAAASRPTPRALPPKPYGTHAKSIAGFLVSKSRASCADHLRQSVLVASFLYWETESWNVRASEKRRSTGALQNASALSRLNSRPRLGVRRRCAFCTCRANSWL
jgi:hypothetical protein